ncbi:MAG TPA: hypothetical protein VLI41_16205 [Phenylobacterium sp.]|uniref:hypothetical protein n=1 Tax=Phenylobacterium sp. TaxID=1871053 RepID=UPI002CA59291|nr:hypothetical protein [Phenylobacterium sp.]HSV04740.1 hypothetical protein [Phenylobacterium sp.]
MKALPMIGGVLVWSLWSSAAMSEAPKQPPMNNFNFAFYTCAQGGAFQVDYDSATPKEATLTTSNNNTRYVLTRGSGDEGVQFSKGAVTLRTSGRTALVEGTKIPFKDCKLKSK